MIAGSVELHINPDLNKILTEGIINGLYKAANLVHKDAVKNCPVNTGNLKNSISMNVNEKNKIGEVGSNVKYAPFVEFSKGKARKVGQIPFLRPALYNNEKEILQIMNDEVMKKLK